MEKNLTSSNLGEENYKEVGRIVREYDALLIKEGVQRPNYEICLYPERGAGFASTNLETREAMCKIHAEKSKSLTDRLWKVAEQLNWDIIKDRNYFLPN